MPNPPEMGDSRLPSDHASQADGAAANRLSLQAFQLGQIEAIREQRPAAPLPRIAILDHEPEIVDRQERVQNSTDKALRQFGAGSTLFASGLSGFVREGANLKDLAYLKNVNPSNWQYVGAESVGSVRYELQRNLNAGSWRLAGEDMRLGDIKTRGAVKGVLAGVGGLVGSMAVDAAFFSDTPRTGVSTLVDSVGMPLIGFAPMNPYLKAGALVGVHTVGRLYEKYVPPTYSF